VTIRDQHLNTNLSTTIQSILGIEPPIPGLL
jgi:hypothetical protein